MDIFVRILVSLVYDIISLPKGGSMSFQSYVRMLPAGLIIFAMTGCGESPPKGSNANAALTTAIAGMPKYDITISEETKDFDSVVIDYLGGQQVPSEVLEVLKKHGFKVIDSDAATAKTMYLSITLPEVGSIEFKFLGKNDEFEFSILSLLIFDTPDYVSHIQPILDEALTDSKDFDF